MLSKAHATAAVLVGVLLALLVDVLVPQRIDFAAAVSPSSSSSSGAEDVGVQSVVECPPAASFPPENAPPSLDADDNSWRCSEFPRRCGVLYHAFSLSWNTNTDDDSDDKKKLLPLWRAVLSAASLRRAHALAGVPQVGGIALATNFPRSVIANARQKYEAIRARVKNSTTLPCVSAESTGWTRDEIFKLFRNQLNILANASSRTIAGPQLSAIFGSSEKVCEDASLYRGGVPPPWPFEDGRIIFLASAESSFLVKPDALAATRGLFDRTLYLDSDTFVRRPVFATLDGSLRSVDIAMAQEFHWDRDLANYLYSPLLLESVQWWTPHVAAPGSSNNGSSVIIKRRKKRMQPTPFGQQHQALYELQFNTGVIAFRSSNSSANRRVFDFFARWSRFHRQLDRCRDDRVLWDQCSLPFALREESLSSSSLRVGILNDKNNFREALGRGSCYAAATTAAASVGVNAAYAHGEELENLLRSASERVLQSGRWMRNDLLQRRVRDKAFPSDRVRILHLFEVKQRQEEWLRYSDQLKRLN